MSSAVSAAAYLDTAEVPPHQGIEIRYAKHIWSNGDAWRHLYAGRLVIRFAGKEWLPYFRPIGGSRGVHRVHPYRAAHTERDWVWTVTEWRQKTPKKRGKVKKKPPPPEPKDRYNLILDESWL